MTSLFSSRFFSALVLFAALLECSAPAQPSASARRAVPRRASIIFIQVDGLGFGDLSCYGQTKFQTPNLDRLAAAGIRFTNYFIADTASLSQAALMTGKNAESFHSGTDAEVSLAPDQTTIAHILNNSGYHTGWIGEWSLGDENSSAAPWKKGFEEFAGYLNKSDAENFYADYIYRCIQKPPINPADPPRKGFTGKEELYPNTGGQKNQYVPDLFKTAALNFVKNNQPDDFNRHQPFFLVLGFKIPQHNIQVPTDAPYSEENWPQQEKNKAALISRIDGYVGELQDQLQKIGMTNNVMIFFSSASVPKKTPEIDPEFFHSNISTNDFRVPMIANWPGTIPAGQISGYKCSAEDFLPTAAEIGYADSPTNIDGTSILPVLLGRGKK